MSNKNLLNSHVSTELTESQVPKLCIRYAVAFAAVRFYNWASNTYNLIMSSLYLKKPENWNTYAHTYKVLRY